MAPQKVLWTSEHQGHARCTTCPNCCAFECHGLFRDPISFREFQISGLCQFCQDEVFGKKEESE